MLCDLERRASRRVNGNVRACVEEPPLLHKRGDGSAAIPRIRTVEHRALAPRRSTRKDGINVCGQCDDDAVFTQRSHVLRVLDNAAARRNDEVPARRRRCNRFLFACAEVWLAVADKHLGDGHAVRFLDLFIEIVKSAAEPSC